MLLNLFLLILSVIFIAKGSDFLTDSLVPLAKKLQTTSISLGLILVSAAVSLPEVLVGVLSAWRGYPEIALGVVFGSIACNVGLMTGVSAMLRPLTATTLMILRDGIFSVVVPILVLAVSGDGRISRLEGFSLFLLFIPYLANVFLQEKRMTLEEREVLKSHTERKLSLFGLQFFKMSYGWRTFLLGVGILLLGSKIFSEELISLVGAWQFSPIVIGGVLGAIGTSIPNIASSLKATRHGLTEVAVSETVGSNIFTLLVTLGAVAVTAPVNVSLSWLILDLPLMILMSLLLFLFMITRRKISRFEGSILFGSYLIILYSQLVYAK